MLAADPWDKPAGRRRTLTAARSQNPGVAG